MNLDSSVKSILVLLLIICSPGIVIPGELNTGTAAGNLAIQGYDPVAYFTEQRAVKGNENIAYSWLGAEWSFSSEKHKHMFSENPVKYAPQYGGHCADGVAYGVTVKYIDPNAWRIIEGRLYLHYDEESAVHLEQSEGELEKSTANWPALRAELLEASN